MKSGGGDAKKQPTRRKWLYWAGGVASVAAISGGIYYGFSSPSASDVPEYTFEIINEYPHDPLAFTQGLVYSDGIFYESTGNPYDQKPPSTLRKVEITTGRVLASVDIDERYFAEGIALWENKIIQLTWRSRVGFVYDKDSLQRLDTFLYSGEGWGLTHDGAKLILSDGSADLCFMDPETLQQESYIPVKLGRSPKDGLNELEYIKGEVYANVFQTDTILRIDPTTGLVVGVLDLTGLRPRSTTQSPEAVLNGIAYDQENDRLFVTGKYWPKLFEIRQVAKT